VDGGEERVVSISLSLLQKLHADAVALALNFWVAKMHVEHTYLISLKCSRHRYILGRTVGIAEDGWLPEPYKVMQSLQLGHTASSHQHLVYTPQG
jgi:hypothetical protein